MFNSLTGNCSLMLTAPMLNNLDTCSINVNEVVSKQLYQFEICEFSVPCFDVRLEDDAVVVDGARVGFSIKSETRPTGFCCLESIGGGGKFRWKSSIIRSIAVLSSSTIVTGALRFAELKVPEIKDVKTHDACHPSIGTSRYYFETLIYKDYC